LKDSGGFIMGESVMVESDDKLSTNSDKTQTNAANTSRKKTYASPTLFEYGSVAKLTQAGGASEADGPVGMMMS
jgi:hypothetical protein